jgi:hypothetical protein
MLAQFFQHKNDQMIFTGEVLKVYVPKRYENRGLLVFGDINKVLGIFEMEVFDSSLTKGSKAQGLVCPCMLSTIPSTINSTYRRGIDCYVFEYNRNQIFLTTTTVLKQEKLAYAIFMEMLSLGNIPAFMTYDQIAFLFDKVIQTTGANLNINHSVFEMIYSHLFRDAEHTGVKYRHTDMKKPPTFVALRSVSEALTSNTSRLYGSYAVAGLDAALTDTVEYSSELENLIRE